jgi:hypothetical protein
MNNIQNQASNIMRTSKFWLLLTVCSAIATTSLLAQAQAAKTPPPDLQKLEEGSPADVTTRKPEPANKSTETREQGVVTDVQVQSGKSHYHLKQSAGPGNSAPGDSQTNIAHPAQWQIKQFDLGRKPDKEKSAEGLQTTDVPPPPPPVKK